MIIKDLRKIEGIAKVIQVYSTKAQTLTDSSEARKFEEVLRSSIKELCDYVATLPVPVVIDQKATDAAFMKRVADGEEVGICESCQG